jgi:hypothetical protein
LTKALQKFLKITLNNTLVGYKKNCLRMTYE